MEHFFWIEEGEKFQSLVKNVLKYWSVVETVKLYHFLVEEGNTKSEYLAP